MGSSFAAFMAGNNPEIIATTNVITKALNMASHGVVKSKLKAADIANPINIPKIIPKIPPN